MSRAADCGLLGLRMELLFSNIRSAELLDNFDQHVGSSGSVNSRLVQASNQARGWEPHRPGDTDALDDFRNPAAIVAVRLGFSRCREFDSFDSCDRPGGIAG